MSSDTNAEIEASESSGSDDTDLLTDIEVVPIDDLTPYSDNPKRHPDEQVEKIASSIRTYGWDVPIVVDDDTEIIKGHGRLQAAEHLGLDYVPVIRRDDLSDAEKRASRLADNRTAESDWDDALLETEMELLEDADFDLDLTGFDEDEIEDYLQADEEGSSSLDYESGSLERDFGVPPFSILDTRQGYWQDRRDAWDTLGLAEYTATIGRDEGLTGSTMFDGQWQEDVSDGEATGVVVNSDGTSCFDPVLAELLYSWFSPDPDQTDAPVTILDPFAGGPVRAAVASVLGRTYTGIDVNAEQVAANRTFWGNIEDDVETADLPAPAWVEGDSAAMDDVLPASDVAGDRVTDVDLVFSCPPYYDLEEYTDDPGDLSNMEYDEFLAAYETIIDRALDRLAPDRFAAFVVSDIRDAKGRYRGLPAETVRAFTDDRDDICLYNEAVLINTAGSLPARVRQQFEGGRKLGRQHQNVLVFYKGDPDPQNIADALGDISLAEDVVGEAVADSNADSVGDGWEVVE